MDIRTSITLCTFNSLQTLPDALRSALNQHDNSFEILILDDGSTDGTWAYLNSLASDPRLRVFRFSHRRGIARARQCLLEHSRGEFISILDADDLLLEDKTRRHGRILEGHPSCGMVYGRAKDLSGDRYFPPVDFVPGWDLVAPYEIVHSATTWRKSALLEVGGYDPGLFCEECPDLFLKIGDFYDQYFDPQPVAVKRLQKDTPHRRYFSQKSKEISHRLILSTLRRRYGSRAAYFERLISVPKDQA